MKIVYIFTALVTTGGADRVVTEKANHLAEDYGYEVYVITDSQCGKRPCFPLSPKVQRIDLDIDFGQQYKYGIVKRMLCYLKLMKIYKRKVQETINEIKPDFVISTLGREVDFITKLQDNSIKIGEAHTTKECIRNLHLFKNKNIFYRIIGKIWSEKLNMAVRNLSQLVVLSNSEKQKWNVPEKTTVIENSLPFYPIEKSSLTQKNIITVGRMSEEKGYDRLINIWEIVSKKHPDWSLHAYGDGLMQPQIEKWIEEKKLKDSFILEGVYPNISEKYLESSVFVMASYFEGFGMALAEAMACGLPCIAFDCPTGPRNIINDGQDGLLIENGNIHKFADGLCYLIENESKRKTFGENARINIKRFDSESIMKKWNNLFIRLKDMK